MNIRSERRAVNPYTHPTWVGAWKIMWVEIALAHTAFALSVLCYLRWMK